MDDAPGEPPQHRLLDRHGGRSPAPYQPTIRDFWLKLVALAFVGLMCIIEVGFCIERFISPSKASDNDLYPIGGNLDRFVTVIWVLLFARGFIWAVSRIRLHLRTKPERV